MHAMYTVSVGYMYYLSIEKYNIQACYCCWFEMYQWYGIPYDMFRNQSTYPTVCLLLDQWHQTDYCITICSKRIFYSDPEVAFPLTQDSLNYARRGNDKYDIKVVGAFCAIRAVIPEVFVKRLNMKK